MNVNMKKFFGCVASLALTTSAAQAGVIGTFVDQGAGLFTFEVTNNDAVLYNAFDLSFTGNFNQGFAPGVAVFSDMTDGLAFGQADTYFFRIDAEAEIPVSSSETLTSLEGTYAFGNGVGVAAGETEVVAVFSTSDSIAPTLVAGSVSAGAGPVQIVVPEPTSLALLGLGSLFIARRRRG